MEFANIDCKKLKRILILRTDGGLGDEVIFSPVYRELKRANPDLHISVFALYTTALFLQKNKYIDKLYTAGFKHLRPHQRWPTVICWALKLARQKYDAVLDIHDRKQKNWALLRAIASRFKYRPVKLTVEGAHFSDLVIAFMKALGIENPDASYALPLTEESLKKISDFSGNKPYILLNPFGRIEARIFTAQTLNLFLSFLHKFEPRQIIIPYLSAPPKTDLPDNARFFHTETPYDLIAAVYKSDIVITPDTAVVHIAAGFRKKTIAFYYESQVAHWHPNNPNAIVIKTDGTNVNNFDVKEFEKVYKSMQ